VEKQRDSLKNLHERLDESLPNLLPGIIDAILGRIQVRSIPDCSDYKDRHVLMCAGSNCCFSLGKPLLEGHFAHLADSAQAPYNQKFCANYHEHREGELCGPRKQDTR